MIALPNDPNNVLALAAGALGVVAILPLLAAVIGIRALWERIQIERAVRQIRRARRG